MTLSSVTSQTRSPLKIDRCRSGLPPDIVHIHSILVRPQDVEIKLRVVLDRSSVEVLIHLRSIFKAAQESGLVAKSPVSSMLKLGGKKTAEKTALAL